MIAFLILFLHVLVSPFKTQARLEAEIVLLRHQLSVLRQRVRSKPKLASLWRAHVAATTALPALDSRIAVSWLYALCLDGAYGSQQAIGAAGYAQYFGRDHLGAIRGTSFVFGIGGAAFGPLPFAASVELTGTYFIALACSCALCLACGAASFAVRPAAILKP